VIGFGGRVDGEDACAGDGESRVGRLRWVCAVAEGCREEVIWHKSERKTEDEDGEGSGKDGDVKAGTGGAH
jgi:hypothetical protein